MRAVAGSGGVALVVGGVRNSGAKLHWQLAVIKKICLGECVIGTAHSTSFPEMGYPLELPEKGNLS